ncbi:hypothetical protein FB446DRAFT_703567 [Lentinula raphanica]|nr:hypothetical protein FB446DRAFT_703567 [Lentinula raphanica]
MQYNSKNPASRPESRFQTLKIKKKLGIDDCIQAKESYKRFIRTQHRRARSVPQMEIPTAPPSPIPVRQGRALRRHDTFYLEPQPTPVTNSNIPTQDLWNTEQGVASEALAEASDSWVIRDTLRLTLEERYNEDSLRTTPLSELPPGFSLEQYVEQSLNRRRVAEFLAYAYALDKSRRSSGSNA